LGFPPESLKPNGRIADLTEEVGLGIRVAAETIFL
jgi:hypothetical protein